jgi:hypothetical protein
VSGAPPTSPHRGGGLSTGSTVRARLKPPGLANDSAKTCVDCSLRGQGGGGVVRRNEVLVACGAVPCEERKFNQNLGSKTPPAGLDLIDFLGHIRVVKQSRIVQ